MVVLKEAHVPMLTSYQLLKTYDQIQSMKESIMVTQLYWDYTYICV